MPACMICIVRVQLKCVRRLSQGTHFFIDSTVVLTLTVTSIQLPQRIMVTGRWYAFIEREHPGPQQYAVADRVRSGLG